MARAQPARVHKVVLAVVLYITYITYGDLLHIFKTDDVFAKNVTFPTPHGRRTSLTNANVDVKGGNAGLWSAAETHSNVVQKLVAMHRFLHPIIQKLEGKRKEMLSTMEWQGLLPVETVADGYKPDYFNKLSKYPNIKTLFIDASVVNSQSVLRQVHNFTATFCDIIREKCLIGENKDPFNMTCERYFHKALRSRPVETVDMEVGFPPEYMSNESHFNLTFLHVIVSGCAIPDGDVFTNNLKIMPQYCHMNNNNMSGCQAAPLYDEVFSISQFWAEGFFHGYCESLPRLTPYIAFLNDHPNIKIHVSSTVKFHKKIFELIGIDKARLVKGSVRAKLLYLPAAGTCGTPAILTANVQSLELRSKIIDTDNNRDLIVLIKRSKKRYFYFHDEIYNMLKRIGADHGLQTWVLKDNPLPSMKEIMGKFNRAVMVVGPHGAGLSNLFFCQSNTVVIEGLSYKHGKVNLCYRNLAHVLGHIWHGVVYGNKNVFHVRASDLEPIVKSYLQTP